VKREHSCPFISFTITFGQDWRWFEGGEQAVHKPKLSGCCEFAVAVVRIVLVVRQAMAMAMVVVTTIAIIMQVRAVVVAAALVGSGSCSQGLGPPLEPLGVAETPPFVCAVVVGHAKG
jgi:hypothetical protein